MQLTWNITDDDVARIKAFVSKQADDALVKFRIKRNLTQRPTAIDRTDFWHALIACLLTTQQRSGPKSHVTAFLNTDPFPLALDQCRACKTVNDFVFEKLKGHGGIRFATKIAKQTSQNLEWLDDSRWTHVYEALQPLLTSDDPSAERKTARFIDDQFQGFGPKQSRNLLQMLGLTRYEIPLDSRIAKWFNKFGFPIRFSAGALADEGVYEFFSDGIQTLCRHAEIYPCVLDAAVFASFDGDGWKEFDNIIW